MGFLSPGAKKTVGNNVTCDQAVSHSLLFERVSVKWGSSTV